MSVGGLGAYLVNRIKKAKIVAYRDLGPGAIHELWVEDFPAIVAIDPKGKSVY